LRHEFLERHHLEFVLRGHGRLQHHAIKKQKSPTWRGFVSNLSPNRWFGLNPPKEEGGGDMRRLPQRDNQ
ncbi:hypothetical protein, partial [Burkholderia mallei]|uniref:hypothetical protein n=2 Tax=Burkholderia mallei TaxID=13373 RepID=UPI001C1074DD